MELKEVERLCVIASEDRPTKAPFHITRVDFNASKVVPCQFMPCHGCKFKVMNGFLHIFLYALSVKIFITE